MRYLLIAVFSVLANLAMAQDNILLTGHVYNEKVEPLGGVTVRIRNTAIATQTDKLGFYSLILPQSKA
ncbi:MAG TPA: hypothetical protein VLZ28_02670, partial [Daejeonella sp.]|nr:hypothetical protein [Daejeonella sp.]